jgi:hypothetical protein
MKKLLVLLVVIVSCTKSLDYKINQVIDEITLSNIQFFKNIAVNTRGKMKHSEDYLIVSFTYFQTGSKDIVLPPIDKIGWIVDTSKIFRYNIQKFGEINGVKEEDKLYFYLKYFNDVTSLFKRINVVELYNNPNLGDFTVFRIDANTDLIYLNDSMRVNSEYWKNFFKNNQPYKDKWYLQIR